MPPTHRIPGLVVTEHELRVPLDHGRPDGEQSFNYRGTHFQVESAKLWDLPERRGPGGAAGVGGGAPPPARGAGGEMNGPPPPRPARAGC